MLRSMRLYFLTGENRRNTFASLILLFTFAFYHWNIDPEACGADPIATGHRPTPYLLVSVAKPVSAPTDLVSPIRQALNETEVADSASSGTGASAQTAEPAEPETQSPEGTVLNGRGALKASQKQLLRGQEILEKTPDYSVLFRRHERINGTLLDPQAMNLKVRHEPFSLYMKWTEGDKGRQLIFVKGQNDDKVLVQPGGVTGRLTGAIAMHPDDPRVLAESRYPATCAGLLELTKIILGHHETDLGRATGIASEIRDGESFDGRPCYLTTLVYDNPEVNAEYRKSLILIDKEHSLPVCVRNFTWVEGKASETDDENSLIESYHFTGLEINTQLTDSDFAKSKYRMR